jgi:hypothetical protein
MVTMGDMEIWQQSVLHMQNMEEIPIWLLSSLAFSKQGGSDKGRSVTLTVR